MADPVYYGWKTETGKYRLSKRPSSSAWRPFNEYDTMQAAMTEAGRRGIKIEWEDGVVD